MSTNIVMLLKTIVSIQPMTPCGPYQCHTASRTINSARTPSRPFATRWRDATFKYASVQHLWRRHLAGLACSVAVPLQQVQVRSGRPHLPLCQRLEASLARARLRHFPSPAVVPTPPPHPRLACLRLTCPRLMRRRLQPRRLAHLPHPRPVASSALLLHQPPRSRLVHQLQRRRRSHSELLLRLLQLRLRPRPLELPLPRLLHPRPLPWADRLQWTRPPRRRETRTISTSRADIRLRDAVSGARMGCGGDCVCVACVAWPWLGQYGTGGCGGERVRDGWVRVPRGREGGGEREREKPGTPPALRGWPA